MINMFKTNLIETHSISILYTLYTIIYCIGALLFRFSVPQNITENETTLFIQEHEKIIRHSVFN